jgi:hypothetical protein
VRRSRPRSAYSRLCSLGSRNGERLRVGVTLSGSDSRRVEVA